MLKDFPGIKENETLAPYSTYKIGGPARYFINLGETLQLPNLIKEAQEEEIPIKIIGGGTNILFKDEGFDGLIIRMTNNSVIVEDDIMITDAGVRWNMAIMQAQKHGFNCLNPLSGLPGTLGGAVYGNAGACDKEMREFVEKVEMIDMSGAAYTLTNQELAFNYRTSQLKKENSPDIITKIHLKLSNNPEAQSGKEYSKQVREIQPPGMSCGCFFTNGTDYSAGKLIDEAGLKGYKVGDAMVSDKHANFILNTGKARAKDILAVADHVKKTIKDKYNIDLEEEVRII